VSETAPTDETVKPAPPIDPEIPEMVPEDKQHPFNPPDWIDEERLKIEVEEIDEQGNVMHDEL